LFHLSTSGYEKAAASRSTNSSFGCFFTTYKIQEKLEKKKKFHLTEYTSWIFKNTREALKIRSHRCKAGSIFSTVNCQC
jgi:hypothetical protein